MSLIRRLLSLLSRGGAGGRHGYRRPHRRRHGTTPTGGGVLALARSVLRR